MADCDQESIPTRPSLLGRLGNWEDQQSWEEFRALYSGLIQRTALRAGLTGPEAQDVEQETLLRVAKNIREFDPAGGNFKAWLLTQVRWRIGDHFRRRALEEKHRYHSRSPDAEGRTATEEGVPDRAGLERVWEEEWQRSLLERAVARLCRRVNPRHAQIVDLCVLRGMSVAEVAKLLEVSQMTVYVVKTRLGKQLKREVDRLRQDGSF